MSDHNLLPVVPAEVEIPYQEKEKSFAFLLWKYLSGDIADEEVERVRSLARETGKLPITILCEENGINYKRLTKGFYEHISIDVIEGVLRNYEINLDFVPTGSRKLVSQTLKDRVANWDTLEHQKKGLVLMTLSTGYIVEEGVYLNFESAEDSYKYHDLILQRMQLIKTLCEKSRETDIHVADRLFEIYIEYMYFLCLAEDRFPLADESIREILDVIGLYISIEDHGVKDVLSLFKVETVVFPERYMVETMQKIVTFGKVLLRILKRAMLMAEYRAKTVFLVDEINISLWYIGNPKSEAIKNLSAQLESSGISLDKVKEIFKEFAKLTKRWEIPSEKDLEKALRLFILSGDESMIDNSGHVNFNVTIKGKVISREPTRLPQSVYSINSYGIYFLRNPQADKESNVLTLPTLIYFFERLLRDDLIKLLTNSVDSYDQLLAILKSESIQSRVLNMLAHLNLRYASVDYLES